MWFQNLSDAEEAGWFPEVDTDPDKFNNLWAMTPTYKLQVPSDQKDIVLLSTGGFAPIHDGHISMMEDAKIHMESQGFRVRGGYLSPGHDDYVIQYKGVRIHAPERLAYANNKLKNHPWLMVDPWESIGCKCAVNFTSVIDHLEKIVGCQVCFVVGSDNQRFCLAFKDKGMLCVVQRDSSVLPNPKYRSRPYNIIAQNLSNEGQHVFVAKNKPTSGSSTEARRDILFNRSAKKKLVLRVDEASKSYLNKLVCILEDYYLGITLVYVRDQHLPKDVPNLVRLDQMIQSPFGNLGLSRNYAEGGYTKLGYINRPSTPSLEEQLSVFAGMNVSLFDDDVVSGNTMRKATDLLKGVSCQVVSYHSLSFSGNNECEIMDSRDFLPVSDGGLVVQGRRVPYIYPYVCPHVRASVLPDQAVEFSDRIRETFWR